MIISNPQISALRHRAYELADTGNYRTWDELAAAFVAEGAPAEALRGLADDGLFQIMLRSRLNAARRAI